MPPESLISLAVFSGLSASMSQTMTLAPKLPIRLLHTFRCLAPSQLQSQPFPRDQTIWRTYSPPQPKSQYAVAWPFRELARQITKGSHDLFRLYGESNHFETIWRKASAVPALAGKKDSNASSDKVMSTGVPKTVVVLKNERTPPSVAS